MLSTVCTSTQWWSQITAENGLKLLDQHVDAAADWSSVAKTGDADWDRAKRLTGLGTGQRLSLLEIGCGAGRMTGALAGDFGEVVALDVSAFYLDQAREHCDAKHVEFRAIQGNGLAAAADRAYDVAFSYEVFHYLAPRLLQQYIEQVFGLLRPGGQFVFELNTRPLGWRTRASLIVRRLLHACGKSTWRGWPTSPHFVRKAHPVREITQRLEAAGFRVSQVIQPGGRETWFVATKPQCEN